MFPRSRFSAVVGSACVFLAKPADAGIVGAASPIGDLVLGLLNAAIPTINPEIDKVIPDPLQVDVGSSKSAGECITSAFHHCLCHADYDYQVHFGTIKGLKEFSISKFTGADIDANYEGTLSAQFGAMDVGLSDGKAHVHGKVCGIGAHADGTASAKVKFESAVNVKLKGSFDVANKCVSFSISGSSVSIHGLHIHDAHAKISLDGLPHFDVGSLAELIEKLDPKLNDLIVKEVNKELVPLLVKLVDNLGCIKIPIHSRANDSQVIV